VAAAADAAGVVAQCSVAERHRQIDDLLAVLDEEEGITGE